MLSVSHFLQKLEDTPAMAITETKPVKQLRELLQEQQEPFILNIYLLERGYSRKSSDSESSSRFCHVNSRKSQKRSVGRGLNISKRVNPQGSKVLRAVLKQVISIKQMLRINSSDHRGGKRSMRRAEVTSKLQNQIYFQLLAAQQCSIQFLRVK